MLSIVIDDHNLPCIHDRQPSLEEVCLRVAPVTSFYGCSVTPSVATETFFAAAVRSVTTRSLGRDKAAATRDGAPPARTGGAPDKA
jgi:hypothetical protein